MPLSNISAFRRELSRMNEREAVVDDGPGFLEAVQFVAIYVKSIFRCLAAGIVSLFKRAKKKLKKHLV